MKYQDMMQQYLADQEVLYMKLRNMHYNVQGANFFTLHEKLEELYGETEEVVDAVAERLVALGELPVSGMKKALEMSKIKELDSKPIDGQLAAQNVIDDFSYGAQSAKEISLAADEAEDVATADMFNGFVEANQKTVWMFSAYLGKRVSNK